MRALVLFFILISQSANAQKDSLTEKINREVWYPFLEYYGAFDAESFRTIHTKDVLRGGPWGIRVGEEYLGRNEISWEKRKADGWTRDISFTFEHRVIGDGNAYEVGYYKVVNKNEKTEEMKIFYGQFHVVLTEIDGKWLIAQDWDADVVNGHEVGEMDFLKHREKGIIEN